jgi:hypothetical protein
MVPHANQQARHEPLYDVHPRTGASIEVFYADRTLETFGRGERWLVLVVSPTRVFARQSGGWSVCYELRSVSARDDFAGADASALTFGTH